MINIECEYTRPFLNMIKITDFPWQGLISHFTDRHISQNEFLDATIFHPQLENFPLNEEYVKLFLKRYIQELEDKNIEVHESVYDRYINLVNSKKKQEEYYRSYYINNIKIVLKETRNLVTEGTTGLTTWQASRILADYCLENSCLFKSKNVLELGSGLGLTGLLLVKSLDLNSYTFTDHHSKVLEFLQHNVTINLLPKQEDNSEIGEFSTKYNNTSVQIQCLDWEASNYSQKYDIILGADVVFDRRLIPHLINVVLKSLKRKGKAIFASTIRNVDTYNYFLHKLEEKKLKIESTEERTHKGSLSQTDVSIVKIITFQIEEEIRTTQE